jgi:glycosyltransferase involved in cell wall biosynthesis
VVEVGRLDGPNPTQAQRNFVDKMCSGPLKLLAIIGEVPPRATLAFPPVAKRLCYVLHNSLPHSSGGYATRAQGMALGLTAAGSEVICLTRPGFPVELKPESTDADFPEEEVIDGISNVRIFEPRRSGNQFAYIRAAADAIESRLRRFRPEVVVAASAYISALPALIAARRLGLPFIYEVRGFWEITRLSREPEFEETAHFKVQRLIEGEIANQADHVFTLTGPMREELVERGVAAENITLLPNSCDPERFTPRPRDEALAARLGIPAGVPVIGYIGTFVQYEGLDDLARACARLRARGVTFRLMLVGNENTSGAERGPTMTEIDRVAVEEGLADWLIMPGRVPHAEVEAYYSLIDIAPFPRKPQPVTEMVSPMKPLEALAMEKAVVVSSVRALTEMIADDETGLVFRKGSVESLADVLGRLIDDPELRARLGRTARDWVTRERTWTATAKSAQAEILRVTSEAPTPDPSSPRGANGLAHRHAEAFTGETA